MIEILRKSSTFSAGLAAHQAGQKVRNAPSQIWLSAASQTIWVEEVKSTYKYFGRLLGQLEQNAALWENEQHRVADLTKEHKDW